MTLKAPPLLVVVVQQLHMHAGTVCAHSGLGAGERAMTRAICSAVETEAVRCGILSPHCNSVKTFNNATCGGLPCRFCRHLSLCYRSPVGRQRTRQQGWLVTHAGMAMSLKFEVYPLALQREGTKRDAISICG